MKKSTAIIHQKHLYDNSELINKTENFIIVEEYLFFKQFSFHKQKILFHRISMKKYESYLLKLGKKLGNDTENGKMMFVYQAAAAFKIWHGVIPEINAELLKLLD